MAVKRKASSSSSSKKSKKTETSLTSSTSQNVTREEAVTVEDRAGSSKELKRDIEVEEDEEDCQFMGDPVPEDEAHRRWPHRYEGKSKKADNAGSKILKSDSDEDIIQARRHYTKAKVDGIIYNLGDDAHVKAAEEQEDFICRILEMFQAVDGSLYFAAQWYYRAKDTVIQRSWDQIDKNRVFFSEITDDNPLNCLVMRLNIVRLPLDVDLSTKEAKTSNCDYYCDMMYLLPYSSFVNLPPDDVGSGSESDSTISSEADNAGAVGSTKFDSEEVSQVDEHKAEMTLLDVYSGCGAMSTGLCLGANMAGVNLVTKWAVDLNKYACESLKYNHPESEVRNESAEDFLYLLKEWKELCQSFSLLGGKGLQEQHNDHMDKEDDEDQENESDGGDEEDEVFEVEKILAICYGDPKENEKRGLYFKIRWKGYGPSEDTWEPRDGLGDCNERIKEFVTTGYQSKILPLPGDVDVICGGPPCQGISGFNRFRNKENPLEDIKNKQLVVFMDIVDFLKPRFVLMENVVDIVKFSGGFLGRYALGRLVGMDYQARMGMMAAGCYGLPQFRMRVFIWGAQPLEKLPQYPLPTHNVVVRGVIPTEFEGNTVAYEEGQKVELEKELVLKDAISDLPPVKNDETRDEMPYAGEPDTEFQRSIRSTMRSEASKLVLFDHRPLQLNMDDYQRVCQIPMRKGANFRDLKGVRVRGDNKVEWDPDVVRVYLPSGKPLVPDYAMSFVGGTSSKPFARLWWDETVPTVVTRAEPHNQAILHPEQDRVLTIRENARLQGFPDCYKLFGPIKERYIQVGNAVAVPVTRALGYAMALAIQGSCPDGPLLTLPRQFPNIPERLSPAATEDFA